MHKEQPREPGWMLWPINNSVEYQIEDDCLRIRRWENGSPKLSPWSKWNISTEETIRAHLRIMNWDALPQHHKASRAKIAEDGGALFAWLRNHLPSRFQH